MNDQPEIGRIEADEHILPIRVYYEDTDFTGVVYHANYIKYFERGRSDFLRFVGMSHNQLAKEKEPLAFAVAKMEIDFKRPAKIDDALTVRTRFMGSKGPRLIFHQNIYRESTLLCAGIMTIVQINMDGQLIRPTSSLLNSWSQFQFAQ